jgi:hypothetical protein
MPILVLFPQAIICCCCCVVVVVLQQCFSFPIVTDSAMKGVYCTADPTVICGSTATCAGGQTTVAARSTAAASKSKRNRNSLDIGYEKKSLHQVGTIFFVLLFLFVSSTVSRFFPPSSHPTLQLKSLLTARGIPHPPADQIQKEILVAILQASDADTSAAADPDSTLDATAEAAAGSLCAVELEQMHLEIIEQAAAMRQENIKNPVKAQALRRLTTGLEDLGVSSLSSHIPPSQGDIKR